MKVFERAVDTAETHDLTAQLPELSAALEEQRRFRTEQLAELAALAAQPTALLAEDPRDLVTEVIRVGALVALSDIDAALRRIALGSYGRCEQCAAAIPLERLEILPMAGLCMRCQHRREALT